MDTFLSVVIKWSAEEVQELKTSWSSVVGGRIETEHFRGFEV